MKRTLGECILVVLGLMLIGCSTTNSDVKSSISETSNTEGIQTTTTEDNTEGKREE